MNDFELHYIHRARSRELIAEADNTRLAREARRGAAADRREGIVARVSNTLRRKEARDTRGAHRFQLAK